MIEMLCDSAIKRVAIVDDDDANTKLLSFEIEDCSWSPVVMPKPYDDLEALLAHVKDQSDAVICDHCLSFKTRACFYGAEAVARWFQLGFPALLVTQFAGIHRDTSIRQWRRNIPVVLPRDKVDPETIKQGFRICKDEIENKVASFRIPRRAIVRVVQVAGDCSPKLVEAFVPQWNPREAVRFPTSLLGDIEEQVESGTRLLADVNIGARNADELYFDNISLAPEPDPNDGLM